MLVSKKHIFKNLRRLKETFTVAIFDLLKKKSKLTKKKVIKLDKIKSCLHKTLY